MLIEDVLPDLAGECARVLEVRVLCSDLDVLAQDVLCRDQVDRGRRDNDL